VNRKTFIVLKHSQKKHKRYVGGEKKRMSYSAIYKHLVSIKKDYAYLNSLGNKTEKKIVNYLKKAIIGIYVKRRK
jgi:predicted patatin/cPLA2 family phospholipase